MKRTFIFAVLVALALVASAASAQTDPLAASFAKPPASARPWVYWFWLNGNITKVGITADLEAMKRAGVGGVLIMEVDQGAPVGPVDFMSDRWRDLFKFVISEATRLGLQVNMNDDAGWNGSGGPWITPDHAMQKVVWTETNVEGPSHFDAVLAQPETRAGYYRDISVYAFPSPGAYRIPNIAAKSALVRDGSTPDTTALAPEMIIQTDRMVDLTNQMQAGGQLAWDVPEGKWTILRMGYAPTGAVNAPAPASGTGLECDKLSKDAMDAQFDGMMGKLIQDVGPEAGHALIATHIDSWENGSQNWTAKFRDEFMRLRGYDPLPYLPVYTGRVVKSLAVSERFLWDVRQTVSDLVVDNYAGRLAELAHQHGMRLSIEAYGGPCDDVTYAGRADEPMCEFWTGGGALETVKEMASAVHIYGRKVLGAESFTSADQERWLEHPGTIKALGDMAFCGGVNRYVVHRYAMQPWADRKPGMTMGPWGLHYERTQTWWNQSLAWHTYVARCQHLLRQGQFVADLLYLQPEGSPNGAIGHPRKGWDYDLCSPEIVLNRLRVQNGKLVLPSGMVYRALVLANSTVITPKLLAKVRDLVAAGATVIGPRPDASPSLSDYPQCDDQVRTIAEQLWGNCDGKTVLAHAFGKGRVYWLPTAEAAMARMHVLPDFQSDRDLNWIHRRDGATDLYFVAHRGQYAVNSVCSFRITGKRPELWHADTGRIELPACYTEAGGVTRVPLRFEPSGSVFVVFRHSSAREERVIDISRNGVALGAARPAPKITVLKALWGPPGDERRTKDVTDQVQQKMAGGLQSFVVAELANEGDPAVNILKTLRVDYMVGGKRSTASANDSESIAFDLPADDEPAIHLERGADGHLVASFRLAGRYEIGMTMGQSRPGLAPGVVSGFTADQGRTSFPLKGPWNVSFAPNLGAPPSVQFPELISWSKSDDEGVRYFSGTGTYRKTIRLPASLVAKGRNVVLDLGNVEVMADVTLNGKPLGTLWKRPYAVDVTGIAKPGDNTLELKVTNLWINRMIGDEQLPEDSDRNPGGTLKSWPDWVLKGLPSPTGRYTFTTWRLWGKNDALRDSGLLGPVRFESTATTRL